MDYLVRGEPRGPVLSELLSIAAESCETFLFVVEDLVLSDFGRDLIMRLEPWLIRREETGEYPAGTLAWGTVTAYTYRITDESMQIIRGATDRLFHWLQPDLPSDLCFLRYGQPWMTTMASDREVVLSLDDQEYVALRKRVPALRLSRVQ